jgi:hypothetical protein
LVILKGSATFGGDIDIVHGFFTGYIYLDQVWSMLGFEWVDYRNFSLMMVEMGWKWRLYMEIVMYLCMTTKNVASEKF